MEARSEFRVSVGENGLEYTSAHVVLACTWHKGSAMKIDATLPPDEMLAELKKHMMRRLMDEQTTQSFNGALRADPDKIVISARDARAAIERVQHYVGSARK